jgi:hypothetical protein
MKHAFGMGSGAMICVPNFIEIGSSLRRIMGGYTDTQKHGDLIRILLFFS